MVNLQKASGQADKARMNCHQSGFGPEADIQHARVNSKGYEDEGETYSVTVVTSVP